MVDSGAERFSRDEDHGDGSLLNLMRAVWQVRWLVLVFLLVGTALGFWHDSRQPRFRTTTAIRWLSPGVSYLYSGYWDIVGRIRGGQIRAIMGSHPQGTRASLRTGKDTWLVQLEVLHDEPGQGKTIGEEILRSLRQLDAETAKSSHSPKGDGSPFRKLQKSLTELESLLASIPQKPSSAIVAPDDPMTRLNQQFTTEAGPRLPLENLPLVPWYRSLQVRSSHVLAAAAAEGTAIPVESIDRVMALQQVCTEQLLECWWSVDLLVSSGPLPGFQVESVSEQSLANPQRLLQSVLLGFWLAGVAAVLLAIPYRWLRVHWGEIVRPDASPGD